MSTLTFENNPERHRYEAFADGVLTGYSEYNLVSDSLAITHTEVLREHEGRGIAAGGQVFLIESARLIP